MTNERHAFMWIITADWDNNFIASGPMRKRIDAIDAFMLDWKDEYPHWRAAKSNGWRALKAKVVWYRP